jgi:hypothetical protein
MMCDELRIRACCGRWWHVFHMRSHADDCPVGSVWRLGNEILQKRLLLVGLFGTIEWQRPVASAIGIQQRICLNPVEKGAVKMGEWFPCVLSYTAQVCRQ